MKALLDENLPHRLRNALTTHEVFTVRYQGWSGLKNGELLRSAESAGFQVFLTGDQTSLHAVQAAIDAAATRSLQVIEVGHVQRKPSRSQ